jgi:hypothetical protein
MHQFVAHTNTRSSSHAIVTFYLILVAAADAEQYNYGVAVAARAAGTVYVVQW